VALVTVVGVAVAFTVRSFLQENRISETKKVKNIFLKFMVINLTINLIKTMFDFIFNILSLFKACLFERPV
jgi:hypothetical protein